MDLYKLTAGECSELLKNKEISSRELCEDIFANIEKNDKDINAYITVCKDEALKKADGIDAKRAANEELSPLAGIPIGIKDNISTKDIKTTCASKMLEDYVPIFDASVIERIKNNDMIITGKLNMDEFAMGSTCETSHFGACHNPHDLSKVPGGSSGGSAAAVAGGECTLALGSDTGGSIRQPASFCGIVGMKPTYGRVSRYGLVAFASGLDQIGPMARSVYDVAMLSNVIFGHDEKDSTSVKRETEDFTAYTEGSVKGMKIGVPEEYLSDGISDGVRRNIENAIKMFEEGGAVVERFSLPLTKYSLPAYYILSSAEASSNLARYDGVKYGFRAENYKDIEDLYRKTRTEGFGDEVKRRIMLGTYVLSSGFYDAYYKKAMLTQKLIKQDFSKAFGKYDILLTPTAPTTATRIDEFKDDPKKMYMSDICTVGVNIAGLPGLVLPCGKDEAGMPCGMQLIADKFNESKLICAGADFERISNIKCETAL